MKMKYLFPIQPLFESQKFRSRLKISNLSRTLKKLLPKSKIGGRLARSNFSISASGPFSIASYRSAWLIGVVWSITSAAPEARHKLRRLTEGLTPKKNPLKTAVPRVQLKRLPCIRPRIVPERRATQQLIQGSG